jgi:hypothetical protein
VIHSVTATRTAIAAPFLIILTGPRRSDDTGIHSDTHTLSHLLYDSYIMSICFLLQADFVHDYCNHSLAEVSNCTTASLRLYCSLYACVPVVCTTLILVSQQLFNLIGRMLVSWRGLPAIQVLQLPPLLSILYSICNFHLAINNCACAQATRAIATSFHSMTECFGLCVLVLTYMNCVLLLSLLLGTYHELPGHCFSYLQSAGDAGSRPINQCILQCVQMCAVHVR